VLAVAALAAGAAGATAPGNDAFASAQTISGPSGTISASTVDATKETGEPNHAGNVGGHSIWYSWTAPGAGTVTIDTVGSDFDTVLAVYTGSSVGALTAVASNDDIVNGVQQQSRVSFTVTSGTTYQIAVDGWRGTAPTAVGAFGNAKLNWSLASPPPAPANDAFASAQSLSGSTASATANSVGATKEAGEPNHAGDTGGSSIWFRWTAPSGGSVTIDTVGSDFDTVLAVYTGSSVGALTAVASNDDIVNGVQQQSRVSFTVTSGTTYQIAVDGWHGAAGNVKLNLALTGPPPAPANDAFAAAQALSGSSASATGSNVNATKEAGEPNHAGNAGGHSVWYRWTAPTGGTVTIDTTGSDFDTLLAVYTGSAVGALTAVASNDDASSSVGQSAVTFSPTAGTTYQIAVDGWRGTAPTAVGAFGNVKINLALSGPPANDAFAGALPLSGTSGTVTGSNTSATKEPGEPNHAGNAGGHSLWYRWTAPADATLTLDTVGSSFDTLLAVYRGTSVNALTAVASNDDLDQTTGLSRVSLNVTGGTTYQIAVDGWRGTIAGAVGAFGSVTLNWATTAPAPANDGFVNPQALTGSSGSVTGTNVSASKETGEPNHAGNAGGHSVWYAWTAPASGAATIDLTGSSFDTLLAVYTGKAVNALTTISSNDDASATVKQSSVTFAANAGTTYAIAVDGSGGATGSIALAWSLSVPSGAPANDAFSAAQTVSGAYGVVAGTTIGATKETGEPKHAGDAGGHSIWFRWTAPASGTVAFDTAGSSFDSLLAAYTGSSVKSLGQVASNDDMAFDTSQSRVSFNATAGTTYLIAVDGYHGGAGTVTLEWSQPQSSSDPTLVAAGDIASCDSTDDTATANLVQANPTSVVATLGDNVHEDGRAELFTSCYSPTWGLFLSRTHPAVGNHEYMTPGAAPYYAYFGAAAGDPTKGYYSYDVGTWHVVVLNSNCSFIGGCDVGSPEETWLRADLAAHPTTCTLAYWHHPHFDSGIGRTIDNSVLAFWQDLYAAGADVVLNGHHHAYERFAPQTPTGVPDPARGMRQFTVGTGGYSYEYFGPAIGNSQVRNSDSMGIIKLTLHPTSYDWKFLPVAGHSFTDSGTTACH
jgi:hypothetical protein